MGEEKKHIIYTGEDIQKYLSGSLLPAEMHELEKAALEDEFLAEAIEGYATMRDKDWSKQATWLQEHFSKEGKVVDIRRSTRSGIWKAAAAVLIIGSGIAIFYTLTDKKNTDKNISAVVQSKADSVLPSETTYASASPFTDTFRIEQYKDNTKVGATRPDKPTVDDNSTYASVEKQNKIAGHALDKEFMADSQKNRTDIASNAVPAFAEDDKLQNAGVRDKASSVTMKETETGKNDAFLRKYKERPFIGQVVATDNTPLSFANIRISKENSGTYADAKGNFKLSSPDSLLNIQIKSAGYIPRSYTLRTGILQNKIVLKEDTTTVPQKTIVIGYGTKLSKKRPSLFEPDSLANVEPEDGWDSYDNYVTNNISLSNEILQKKIHGEVQVSFDVQPNGAISNLKIDKSLCADCDQEVLRIIKEGPGWKVKKGKKATAKVKVNF